MNRAITIPEWVRSLVAVGGILLALLGVQLGLGILCRASFAFSYVPEQSGSLFLTFILALSALGTGGALAWQTLASRQRKPSRSLPRPSTDQLIGIGVFYLVGFLGIMGIFQEEEPVWHLVSFLVLPIVFALPSLWVFAWLRGKQADRLTWRYGLIVFTGSGFLSLASLLLWQGFSYFVLLPLRPGLAELFLIDLDSYATSSDRSELVYFLIGVVLITELVKPLPALLLWPQLSQREAFLAGALAGAGFAPLAAALYWLLAPEAPFTVLTLTIIGAASHAFCSGLLTMGWYRLIEKASGWPRWLAYYGLATALQLLWNLGFLIVGGFTGLSGGVAWLGGWFFLLALGLLVFSGSYSVVRQPEAEEVIKEERVTASSAETGLSLALWGVACFLAIVPVGLIVILTPQ